MPDTEYEVSGRYRIRWPDGRVSEETVRWSVEIYNLDDGWTGQATGYLDVEDAMGSSGWERYARTWEDESSVRADINRELRAPPGQLFNVNGRAVDVEGIDPDEDEP